MKKTIDQVEVRSRRVLMRVDFNVPLDDAGTITDDRRIAAALPSIRSVIERGGRLVLASHLGRPEGKGYEAASSLRPAAARLAELLPGTTVRFVEGDCVGAEAKAAIDALRDGEVVLLDNLRFHKGEKKGDPEFARRLAAGMDVYCNDAFGTAHRPDASMVAVPRAMAGKPCVAGFLLDKELRYLAQTIERAGPGFVAVLGGAKVSDKLGAIRNLIGRVDAILVGGAMAYTLLSARGVGVGASRVEAEMVGEAGTMLEAAAKAGTTVHLPEDHHVAEAFSADAPRRIVEGAIPAGWMGLDIGPRTQARYRDVLVAAKTVIWNGPMGVFEMPPFDAGTRAVAEALVAATRAGATTVVGGGDSAAAIEAFGLAEAVSHVSTGGGASLEMLEGRRFESVDLLDAADAAVSETVSQ